MKTPALLVAIVAAALALCGSFAPIVAKAQGAVPVPRDCVKHSLLPDLPDRPRSSITHRLINTCDHDVLVTYIIQSHPQWIDGDEFRDGLSEERFTIVGRDDRGTCIRGGEKWIAPPGDRKENVSIRKYNRVEYELMHGPLDPSELEREDSRLLEVYAKYRRGQLRGEGDQYEDWKDAQWFEAGVMSSRKFEKEGEHYRKLIYFREFAYSCPDSKSIVLSCVEWADEERQKRFEKENDLRGGCREYNKPSWSDASVRN